MVKGRIGKPEVTFHSIAKVLSSGGVVVLPVVQTVGTVLGSTMIAPYNPSQSVNRSVYRCSRNVYRLRGREGIGDRAPLVAPRA